MHCAPGFSAFWSKEKKPRLPGIAIYILTSSPSNICHYCTEARQWDTIVVWRSMAHFWRWGGNEAVISTVWMTYPRLFFWVLQLSSPLRSFRYKIGWFLLVSSESLGQKTASVLWKVDCQTLNAFNHPWKTLANSSTYTYTWVKGGLREPVSLIGYGSGLDSSSATGVDTSVSKGWVWGIASDDSRSTLIMSEIV